MKKLATALLLGVFACGAIAQVEQSLIITTGGSVPPDPPPPSLGKNDPPDANDDNYTVNQDTTLSKSAADGILANDSDANSDLLTAMLGTDVSNGSLTLNADGSFDYAPNGGYVGDDSFTYTANDGTEDSAEATVMITVAAVVTSNSPPTPGDDNVSVVAATSASQKKINVLSNDSDPDGDSLTVTANTASTDVTLGSVKLDSDGSLTFTPNASADGTETFTYTVSDGNGNDATATVTLVATAPIGILTTVCSGGMCGLIPALDPAPARCSADQPYAMNVIENARDGSKVITKRCASVYECEHEWWQQTSDMTECTDFDPGQSYLFQFQCYYCCTTDNCNKDVYPKKETLYKGSV